MSKGCTKWNECKISYGYEKNERKHPATVHGFMVLVAFEIKHKTLQKELVLQKKTATYGFYKQFSKN